MFEAIKKIFNKNYQKPPSTAALDLKIQGDRCLAEKNYQQAISYYQQALKLSATFVDAQIGLAFALIQQNNLDEATSNVQQVLAVMPHHADAHFVLGNIAKKQANSQKAMDCYRRAINIDTQYDAAYRALFSLYKELGEITQAQFLLERAIAALPSSSYFLFERAGLYFAEKDYKNAIVLLKKVLALLPDNMDCYLNIANAYLQLEQHEAAIPYLVWIITANPDNIDIQHDLGNVYLKLGRKQEALACFQAVLRLKPDSPLKHLVAAFSGQTTDIAPTEYIKDLFDQYAENFDSHLTQELHYNTPTLLLSLIKEYAELATPTLNVLDLGCGTGLFGKNIAPFAKQLVGVDLSEKMLHKAAKLNLYQRLEHQELLTMMQKELDSSYDLIAAADVFVYLGRLDSIVGEAKRLLRFNGIFAFSTESLDALLTSKFQTSPQDFQLNDTGRYLHALSYLNKLAKNAGFSILETKEEIIRQDGGKPIVGHLSLWQRLNDV